MSDFLADGDLGALMPDGTLVPAGRAADLIRAGGGTAQHMLFPVLLERTAAAAAGDAFRPGSR